MSHGLYQERRGEVARVFWHPPEERPGRWSPNHSYHPLAGDQLKDFIDEEEWVSVGEDPLDVQTIENVAHWDPMLVAAGASGFPVKTRKYW